MEFLREIYPPVNERIPLPVLYLPFLYALLALTIHIPGKIGRVFLTFPLLLLLTIATPYYTTGRVADDYGSSVAFLGSVLMYTDLLILSPLQNEPIRFTGRLERSKPSAGIGEDDCTTSWSRFKWSMRFITIARGIGWNIQVKGVPTHPEARSSRWDFVRRSALRAVLYHFRRLLSVYIIGLANAARYSRQSSVPPWVLNAVIGWAGGSLGWNGISAIYHTGAALTVALGLFDPWEWPPIFGSLTEAWSVRQMWSVVWHQLIRRLAQQPGIRLARGLGLRKGTIGSKYLQLYVAFAISLLMHEWQIFNAVRRDVGELWFFGPQPFVITAEDFVQWCWRRYRPLHERTRLEEVGAKAVGYVWTFAWFSYCLPPFVDGLMSMGIVGSGMGEPWAIELGQQTAISWLR